MRYLNTSTTLAMCNRNSSVSAASQPGTLSKLFQDAKDNYPHAFVASLIGSGQQKLAGWLYEHLVAQPQYQTSAERQALIRRMREAMVKCIILNGMPAIIEAATAILEVEKPEDQDHSCSSLSLWSDY
ncbi:hypothetical protein HD806DRAFT_540619 [Xylariaceae sp. AK1471]|nr:hypothetical protein HD806DRAFT_540619 [Xylariaceae sp. AK1471]